MSCPFLAEVKMSFCRACPVKLVPSDRVVTESACEGEGFGACPVFRECMARAGGRARDLDPLFHVAVSKEGGGP